MDAGGGKGCGSSAGALGGGAVGVCTGAGVDCGVAAGVAGIGIRGITAGTPVAVAGDPNPGFSFSNTAQFCRLKSQAASLPGLQLLP